MGFWGFGVGVGVGVRARVRFRVRVKSLRFARATDATLGCVILIDHREYTSRGNPPLARVLAWGGVHILVRVGLGSGGRTEANTPGLGTGTACGEMHS